MDGPSLFLAPLLYHEIIRSAILGVEDLSVRILALGDRNENLGVDWDDAVVSDRHVVIGFDRVHDETRGSNPLRTVDGGVQRNVTFHRVRIPVHLIGIGDRVRKTLRHDSNRHAILGRAKLEGHVQDQAVLIVLLDLISGTRLGPSG